MKIAEYKDEAADNQLVHILRTVMKELFQSIKYK